MKTIKVGVDLMPNTFVKSRAIDQLELLITLDNKSKLLHAGNTLSIPCMTPPDVIIVGRQYRYTFYHSYPELHSDITAVNGKFKIQIVVGNNSYVNAGKDITDHVMRMYACKLSAIMEGDYEFSMPGILISDTTEIPLYIIQVDVDYDRSDDESI